MYRNLTQFIARLEASGELHRIKARVDPHLEIAEITDRVSKSPGGGKALLFENTGTAFPVLTNMLGSDRRIAMALGVESLDKLTERIDSLLRQALAPRNGFADKLRALPMLGEMAGWFPRTSKSRGECQQVVLTGGEIDLDRLPVLKCWPYDGGRFVTLPLVHTVDPHTGMRNVGMYRMQVTGPTTTGMHWHVHKTGERHYRAYKRLGRLMPVSVCLGGDPVYTYSATAPMPDNMDEYLLAGFLRRRPVQLVKCLTNDIYVPADCDFVIEGYVDPAKDKLMEGPFGDHTGFYSLEDLYPEFTVTAITHRRDAVYPATIVGVPPQEDAYIAKATEKIFLSPIRFALQPEIEDLYMPEAGVAHNIALVSLDTTYAGQAFKAAASMWGAGQMMFNKLLLVLPSGTDLRNVEEVAGRVRNADLGRDVLLSKGVLDVLDHATATPGLGGKIAFDLTGHDQSGDSDYESAGMADRWKADEKAECLIRYDYRTEIPTPASSSEYEQNLKNKLTDKNFPVISVDAGITDKWGVVLLRIEPEAEIDGERLLRFLSEFSAELPGVKYLVTIDPASEHLGYGELLWLAAGNTDPGRDIFISGNRMFIDARTKSPYREGYPSRFPNVVTSSPETISLVDSRWSEYGFGKPVESPSLKYIPLLRGNGAEVSGMAGSSRDRK